MIFVTVGTQDKSFIRLLNAVDTYFSKVDSCERVVIQKGHTNFESKNFEVVDFLDQQEMEKYLSGARVVITHAGVGSILSALKYEKPIIAAARLKEYGEHTNDHQLEILEEFTDKGHILALEDFSQLGLLLEESTRFKPRPYKSNKENFCQILDNKIKELTK